MVLFCCLFAQPRRRRLGDVRAQRANPGERGIVCRPFVWGMCERERANPGERGIVCRPSVRVMCERSEQIPARGGLFKRLEKYSFSCTHFAIFALRMKKLLTYILPVFLFAVISYGAEGTVSDVSLEDFRMIEESIMAQQFTVSDSTADSEFCLPRQISTANTLRAHNSVKRTSGAYRINTEFIASGKIINAGLRFCIQIKSIITRSSLADPAYRLLKLGKLII